MSGSSLIVAVNALMLKRLKLPDPAASKSFGLPQPVPAADQPSPRVLSESSHNRHQTQG